ncbi:MAG: 50S ribosomal protein L22 [Candidatus Coatesbacteria bacterium]|nr:50S ribosomal protein L22 [Candidatus Coatesbacteria bacterium]
MLARIKYVRISPFKLRRVADVVRGRNVNEAIALLDHMRGAGAPIIGKLLRSALANAASNDLDGVLDLDSLVVKEIQIDQGPTLKRIRFKAKGMFGRIRKRTSKAMVRLAEPAAVAQDRE